MRTSSACFLRRKDSGQAVILKCPRTEREEALPTELSGLISIHPPHHLILPRIVLTNWATDFSKDSPAAGFADH